MLSSIVVSFFPTPSQNDWLTLLKYEGLLAPLEEIFIAVHLTHRMYILEWQLGLSVIHLLA